MNEIFIVYETDKWNSVSSQEMAGIFTSIEDAIDAILENNMIDAEEFDDYDIDGREVMTEEELQEKFNDIIREQLESFNQTQCFNTNYVIEQVSCDSWLI